MKYAMSARSITIAIQGVAIIGLAATGLTAHSAEMAAAATAQLVQNVDEPARNLYQQEVAVSGNFIYFTAVPAGKTLRITHASCYVILSDTSGLDIVALHSGTGTDKREFISSAAQGNAQIVVANSEINLYSSAGSKPYVEIETNTATIGEGACTLSGYFVTN